MLLPERFSVLEPFVAGWIFPAEKDRHDKRITSNMDELRSFYSAMLPLMPDILNHLEQLPAKGLSAQDERLSQLTLMLAEISPCVELFNSPTVPDAVDSRRLSPVEG